MGKKELKNKLEELQKVLKTLEDSEEIEKVKKQIADLELLIESPAWKKIVTAIAVISAVAGVMYAVIEMIMAVL